MPNQRARPTLRRRRLGDLLRETRESARLSSDEAARLMGWDPTRLSKIENARARISATEISELMKAYGVEDESLIGALAGLAKDAGKRGWWQTYGDVVAAEYSDYISLESDAESMNIYAPSLIPGLLQTGAYAREVIAATSMIRTPEEVTALAEVRKTRQVVLTRTERPLKLWAVIDERALLHRFAGHPSLMREQLRHLLDMADLPNITIQVMAIGATPHPGMLGLFHVVHFRRPWPTVVHLENIMGSTFVEGSSVTKVYEDAFDLVVAAALPVDYSRERIKSIMEGNGK
ncbi:helix-turn-helix domain-containing protein [Streptomyces sp. NPDC001407]|uniref:helix-turn-helix domain-containing protein n=1 Tax=Streptomyces sp. NPDC001407 TaxID=3364573 RepID=UPI00368B8D3B